MIKVCILELSPSKNTKPLVDELRANNIYVEVRSSIDPYNNYYDFIIPISVNASIMSAKYRNSIYDNPQLVKDLNDKIRMYDYIPDGIIDPIPTLDLKYASDRDIYNFVNRYYNFQRFLFKPLNRGGAHGQKIYDRNNMKMCEECRRKGILQPYFEDVTIYATELVAKQGEILYYMHIIESEGHITANNKPDLSTYEYPILDQTNKYYDLIDLFTKELISKTKYSGFMEIEYLIHNNEIYFLEINPRISGAVRTKYYIYKNKKIVENLYVKKIIMSFLN